LLDLIIAKGQIFILDSGEQIKIDLWYTQGHSPKSSNNHFKAFRSEKNKNEIDSESECSEDSASLYGI
jgi:hypothetical protein